MWPERIIVTRNTFNKTGVFFALSSSDGSGTGMTLSLTPGWTSSKLSSWSRTSGTSLTRGRSNTGPTTFYSGHQHETTRNIEHSVLSDITPCTRIYNREYFPYSRQSMCCLSFHWGASVRYGAIAYIIKSFMFGLTVRLNSVRLRTFKVEVVI